MGPLRNMPCFDLIQDQALAVLAKNWSHCPCIRLQLQIMTLWRFTLLRGHSAQTPPEGGLMVQGA